VMLFPVYWMVNASLQPFGSTLSGALFPWHPDTSGYERAISEQGRNLMTSLVVALLTVVVVLVVATPAAYALAQFRFRWTPAALLVVLVTQMIPSIIIAGAAYTAYSRMDLLNTVPGLVLADASHGVPFAILVLYPTFSGIPKSIIEAARIDGAGLVRTFRSIVVPVSRNGIITAGLFSFLFAWGDFLFALTLPTDPTVRPITLGIYNYLGTNVSSWSAVMATGVLASIPAIALLLVAQKYIAAGAVGGAVK
jgi:multiple sugar transport system permease protein